MSTTDHAPTTSTEDTIDNPVDPVQASRRALLTQFIAWAKCHKLPFTPAPLRLHGYGWYIGSYIPPDDERHRKTKVFVRPDGTILEESIATGPLSLPADADIPLSHKEMSDQIRMYVSKSGHPWPLT